LQGARFAREPRPIAPLCACRTFIRPAQTACLSMRVLVAFDDTGGSVAPESGEPGVTPSAGGVAPSGRLAQSVVSRPGPDFHRVGNKGSACSAACSVSQMRSTAVVPAVSRAIRCLRPLPRCAVDVGAGSQMRLAHGQAIESGGAQASSTSNHTVACSDRGLGTDEVTTGFGGFSDDLVGPVRARVRRRPAAGRWAAGAAGPGTIRVRAPHRARRVRTRRTGGSPRCGSETRRIPVATTPPCG
jgi:hypothetical protein